MKNNNATLAQTKPIYKEFEYMMNEGELLRKFPAGTEIESDGNIWISTGKVISPMASNCFASFPRVRFMLKN